MVRDQVERTSKPSFSPHTRFSFGNSQSMSFSSFEELESTLWAQFDQCRAIRGLFDDDLRERLKQLAENGVVMARYIYAMWPPMQGGLGSEETLQMLEHQNHALEYTWLNVDEGEAIGLLAFGQSFGAATPGLFTPFNFMQNQVFLLAAKKCGVSSLWLDAELIRIKGYWIEVAGGFNDLPIEAPSDEIKEFFCD